MSSAPRAPHSDRARFILAGGVVTALIGAAAAADGFLLAPRLEDLHGSLQFYERWVGLALIAVGLVIGWLGAASSRE